MTEEKTKPNTPKDKTIILAFRSPLLGNGDTMTTDTINSIGSKFSAFITGNRQSAEIEEWNKKLQIPEKWLGLVSRGDYYSDVEIIFESPNDTNSPILMRSESTSTTTNTRFESNKDSYCSLIVKKPDFFPSCWSNNPQNKEPANSIVDKEALKTNVDKDVLIRPRDNSINDGINIIYGKSYYNNNISKYRFVRIKVTQKSLCNLQEVVSDLYSKKEQFKFNTSGYILTHLPGFVYKMVRGNKNPRFISSNKNVTSSTCFSGILSRSQPKSKKWGKTINSLTSESDSEEFEIEKNNESINEVIEKNDDEEELSMNSIKSTKLPIEFKNNHTCEIICKLLKHANIDLKILPEDATPNNLWWTILRDCQDDEPDVIDDYDKLFI